MDYAYLEVMACPGGCTNGGGQIKVDDLPIKPETAMSQKEWLGRVDEAYYSMSESESEIESENDNNDAMKINDNDYEEAREVEGNDMINGIDTARVREVLEHWAQSTGIDLQKLVTTSYRKVESDVGKVGGAENERVVELAGKIGGGW